MKTLYTQKKQSNWKTVPTSKKLVFFLFINCTCIQVFSLLFTAWSLMLSSTLLIAPDFSAINTLIGAVVTETIGYAVYALKSAKQNCRGGITFEMAMKQAENQESHDVG